VAAGRVGGGCRDPAARALAAAPAGCRGRCLLAAGRRTRPVDAVPVVRHRAPLRLGQREPAAVRSPGAGPAARRVATHGGARSRNVVPPAPGGGVRGRGGRAAAEVGAAVLAGQRSMDRAAAAGAPGLVARVPPFLKTMDPSLPRCVVNCVAYDAHGRRIGDISLDAISDVLAADDGSFVWVGLYEPEDALLAKLQEEFGLHDLAIEDAQHAHQRPKIEAYGDSLFVIAHTAQVVDGGRIAFGETHAFLGRRYLVTVRHGPSDACAPVRRRAAREPELLALGPSYGLYTVLDAIVDNYLPSVDEFGETLVALEHAVFSEEFDRGTVLRLYELKRELTRL